MTLPAIELTDVSVEPMVHERISENNKILKYLRKRRMQMFDRLHVFPTNITDSHVAK